MLKADKNLVVVGDYSRAYYNSDGYDNLKQILFDENDCSDINNLYNVDNNGDVSINQDVYNKLSLSDIDGDIQEVLIGDDIIKNLVNEEPDDNGNYTCRVRINGGWDYVEIPFYLIDIVDDD